MSIPMVLSICALLFLIAYMDIRNPEKAEEIAREVAQENPEHGLETAREFVRDGQRLFLFTALMLACMGFGLTYFTAT